MKAGETSATFSISATDDSSPELAESFSVVVSQDSTAIATQSLTINASDLTLGTEANAGNYTATSNADVYLYDVKFATDGSVTEASDGNVIITGFDVNSDTIPFKRRGSSRS